MSLERAIRSRFLNDARRGSSYFSGLAQLGKRGLELLGSRAAVDTAEDLALCPSFERGSALRLARLPPRVNYVESVELIP
jgi:hypothetical protein